MESLEIMFSQYKETYKLNIDDTLIGGDDREYYVKKEIRNHIHKNIDVHTRRLIVAFPGDGVKYISKLQSICENITFAYKSRYDRFFNSSHIKEMN